MSVGAVVIGRNEGARLERCLATLAPQVDRLVYVDSGSTDGSAAMARGRGVEVVELDATQPFTAARGRNAGFAAFGDTPPDLVQFVDGDCAVEPGWIAGAVAAFAADGGLGIVTGWRTELAPDANAYHAMAEVEWHQPAGEIAACGGDLMVRAEAFRAAGGFDPAIIASEDEEFVIRVRKAGWRACRLPQVMTRHDIAMTRFAAWWRRNLRSGNGLAEVGDMHPPHFRAERRRAMVYGLALPLVLVLSVLAGFVWPPAWSGAALAVAAYAVSALRVRRFVLGQGMPAHLALPVAGLFTLAKLPHFIGMCRHYLRRLRRAAPRIIEYK